MEWFKQAIIYQVFIDRFSCGKEEDKKPATCAGPVFCGGNLRGVIDRLDYIEELGANAIWLTPFNQTSAYHGYHITDFFDVDPRFGTKETIQELIEEVHRRNMKLIMDFVPNHVSSVHPYFLDAQKNKDSVYRQWFYFMKWPDEYLCFLHFRELPKLNLGFAPARDHIVQAAKLWLSMGFDGLRLDHAFGPSHAFWRHFRQEAKKDFPNAVLFGEAWGLRGPGKASFHDLRTLRIRGKFLKWLFHAGDQAIREYAQELDGALDFTFQEFMRDYIAKKSVFHSRFLLARRIARHYARFPKNFFLPSFLDNHDSNRFLFEAGQDKEKLKEAARMQFAQEQPVIIYYGTETGLSQEKDIGSFAAYGDLAARQMMPWGYRDNDLFSFYQNLIAERKKRFSK